MQARRTGVGASRAAESPNLLPGAPQGVGSPEAATRGFLARMGAVDTAKTTLVAIHFDMDDYGSGGRRVGGRIPERG